MQASPTKHIYSQSLILSSRNFQFYGRNLQFLLFIYLISVVNQLKIIFIYIFLDENMTTCQMLIGLKVILVIQTVVVLGQILPQQILLQPENFRLDTKNYESDIKFVDINQLEFLRDKSIVKNYKKQQQHQKNDDEDIMIFLMEQLQQQQQQQHLFNFDNQFQSNKKQIQILHSHSNFHNTNFDFYADFQIYFNKLNSIPKMMQFLKSKILRRSKIEMDKEIQKIQNQILSINISQQYQQINSGDLYLNFEDLNLITKNIDQNVPSTFREQDFKVYFQVEKIEQRVKLKKLKSKIYKKVLLQ
eukprot:TRINITY_DN42373_c3_g1_i2.p1 TRINITY_DN42373_c3_g1~~TRINITY_DN42373_c3_g1_i2.p1  ORF type:complete len:302 (-),score=21.43 TRINITY_DN42373_c3_g1_i2:535-1440(-)